MATIRRERLITLEYSGGIQDKVSHAATLEGALRAAIIRIAHAQHGQVQIYDCRFGHKSKAITVKLFKTGIAVTWARNPKWNPS
jgi:hypothetical protein